MIGEKLLIELSSIIVLGVAAQWIAWRLSFPSIVLLLLFGFIAGPLTGFLHPDLIFGNLLSPIVSVSVSVILFEGGMSLKIGELKRVGTAIWRLITIGAIVSFVITTLASRYILNLSLHMSFLIGAILIVTGPTVIMPLLRYVKPGKNVSSVLRWEGIITDPIGAMVAVLIYEAIISGGSEAAVIITAGLFKTVFVGFFVGVIGAVIIVIFLNRYWVPDFLQNSISIMIVILSFTLSNIFQSESGLFAVTVMGIVLANQKYANIKHIIEFKENLRVLLISSLFIILSAKLNMDILTGFDWHELYFLLVLFFVARPVSVFVSTFGSSLKFREKLFISWMAPRGVVAAAVASIFTLRLTQNGFHEAVILVPLTFTVIISTVLVYGVTAGPFARFLGVSQANPQGFLIAGAHKWARMLALALKKENIQVVLIDTNKENIYQAKISGIQSVYGNILSEEVKGKIELEGIVRLLAITPNDEVNSLSALEYGEIFGRSEIYQLSRDDEDNKKEEMPAHLQGRKLFGKKITYSFLAERFAAGAVIHSRAIGNEYTLQDFKKENGDNVIIFFKINSEREVYVNTIDRQLQFRPGDTILYISA